MSILKTNYCPHCNQLIETVHNDKAYKINISNRFGNPIKICPFCERPYLDNKIQEPALMSPKNLIFKGISSSISIIAIAVVAAILVGNAIIPVILGDSSVEIDDSIALKLVIPLIIIFSVIALIKFNPWNFKNEINDSLERLKNKDYVKTLTKLNKNMVSPDSAYAKAKHTQVVNGQHNPN